MWSVGPRFGKTSRKRLGGSNLRPGPDLGGRKERKGRRAGSEKSEWPLIMAEGTVSVVWACHHRHHHHPEFVFFAGAISCDSSLFRALFAQCPTPLSPAVRALPLSLSLPLLGLYFPVFFAAAARRVAAKDRGILVNSSIATAKKRKTELLPQSHLQFSFLRLERNKTVSICGTANVVCKFERPFRSPASYKLRALSLSA